MIGTHDDGVARIVASMDGADRHAGRKKGREIFERVDDDVDAPVGERDFEFFGEEALFADFRQGDVENAIARRRNARQGESAGRVESFERGDNRSRLDHRQFALARSHDNVTTSIGHEPPGNKRTRPGFSEI